VDGLQVWNPIEIPGSDSSDVVRRSLSGDDGGRTAMRHIDYLEMMLRNGHAMAHDYSQQSTDEDPHMIAFFDSLVRRERDGWTSEEDDESLSRDDDIDGHALDYHHTEQSSSDESTSEGNRRLQSGVVFRPLRYPQARDTAFVPVDGTSPVAQTERNLDRNTPLQLHRRRRSRRAMLRRLGQMIPITSFVSRHSPSVESSSESTTTTTVDSSSDDSDGGTSSSTSKSSESSRLVDQSPSHELSESADPCRGDTDPLTLKQSRDSLSRLKRLRERALNSDDDGGEFLPLSPSAATKCNLLPSTISAADLCDNRLDACKSPVKLNGKSQSCLESANGVADICRLSDFTRNTIAVDSHECASVDVSSDGPERHSSASVDQELCSILHQVSNGDATGVDSSSAEQFHRRHRRTKSGSRRYRRAVADTDADHSTDED